MDALTDMPAAVNARRTAGMARPWCIDRHDLLAALDRAAEHKVTVISAPACSGKTSLLRAFPEAAEQVTMLLTDLPAQAHAIVGTRRDLPLRLHRLRLTGDLAEIRASQLRFTEAETREPPGDLRHRAARPCGRGTPRAD